MNASAGRVPPSDIADAGLAEAGRARIEWAQRGMPVLRRLTERFAREQPFAGLAVAACLHVTAETAGLVGALRAGGARVFLAASNPLSTQDDVAAALAAGGHGAVFARAGVDEFSYAEHIHRALDCEPDLVIDDGGDLVNTLCSQRPELAAGVRGGCESTATGVIRLRRMAEEGALPFPMVAADETETKRMFDNTYGTGQSVIDGVLRATNVLLAGRVVVVAGFGPCGRGIAERAHGLGAQIIVTEVDPVRALAAVLHGYRVLPMSEAAAVGQIFITATGSRDVIGANHLVALRDGAILANAGHFDVEIDVRALAGAAVKITREVRPHADEYVLADGRRLVLLAEGRVVNLVAAEGNPPAVMDVSFAGQALALGWLAHDQGELAAGVHRVPPAIDGEIARLTLESAGTRIDTLTPTQRDYLTSWRPRL
ncbi:MAG TPA: adenosylhomocysteinase [Streptosporangiaceae bacterium]